MNDSAISTLRGRADRAPSSVYRHILGARCAYNPQEAAVHYEASAAEADKAGGAPDLQTFLYQRDALVKYTRERLKLNLTATGMARLDAHVQQEKRGMKVAKEVQ